MRVLKKICALVYLVASLAIMGCVAGLIYPSTTARVMGLLEHAPVRVALLVSLAVVAIGVLVSVIRAFVARREPDAVYADGNPDIQVSSAALVSCARAAAQGADIMVEHVTCRIAGADRARAQLTIEAIAFTQTGLKQLAGHVEARVRDACETMLGCPGVSVRVRFLPSKTTVIQGGAS